MWIDACNSVGEYLYMFVFLFYCLCRHLHSSSAFRPNLREVFLQSSGYISSSGLFYSLRSHTLQVFYMLHLIGEPNTQHFTANSARA